MSFTVIIPARYASTRLPGKVLADICGKPMIAHVVERANESSAVRTIVATDDQRIADALADAECEVCMTRSDHQTGSDRLQEVVQQLDIGDDEIVVNVQGDEPLVPGQLIDQVAAALEVSQAAVMSTAAKEIIDPNDIDDPNIVKVVFAQNGRALYFSRAPIPYARDSRTAAAWHHIGIYAYRGKFLRDFHLMVESEIEKTESLEQLRALDNGNIIMVETVDYPTGIGVDTPADLEKVRTMIASHQASETQ